MGVEEDDDQDCEPSLLISAERQGSVQHTGYQYAMILPGLHSCKHTPT